MQTTNLSSTNKSWVIAGVPSTSGVLVCLYRPICTSPMVGVSVLRSKLLAWLVSRYFPVLSAVNRSHLQRPAAYCFNRGPFSSNKRWRLPWDQQKTLPDFTKEVISHNNHTRTQKEGTEIISAFNYINLTACQSPGVRRSYKLHGSFFKNIMSNKVKYL